ncbi:MAG: GNAT family N-acetyltransferase [archaeon]
MDKQIKIDIWKPEKIINYVSQDLPTHNKFNNRVIQFKGFSYFSPELEYDILNFDLNNKYEQETDLSPLEIQTKQNFQKKDYVKAIVATKNKSVVGFLLTRWAKFYHNYWFNQVTYIDVHKDFQNQGIGTELMKTLNSVDFAKNKILYIGMLSDDGEKYMRPVIEKELKAKDYALVYEDYVGSIPTTFGVYKD